MPTQDNKHIQCTRLKVRKHRENPYPCLHCIDCTATWGDHIRALSYLKTFDYIVGVSLKEKEL